MIKLRNKKSAFYINVFKKFSPIVLVIAALMLYGCSDSSTGANGSSPGNGAGNGGEEIGTEPTFNNVSQIFSSTCAPCHINASDSGVRLDSYENVMNSVGDQYGILVVQPGDANGSPLVDKIESSNPQFGVRMPENESPLSSARINQIRTWINDGAENGSNGNDEDDNGGSDY